MQDTDWANIAETGLYTVSRAARLLATKPQKIRAWVEGYGHSDASPILIRQLPRVGGKTVLGFLDLIESAFVRHFQTIGYSPQTIRKVALKLRERHGVDHPFAMDKLFNANGKYIFEEVVTDEGEKRLVNLMNDNFEIIPAVEPSLFDQVFYVRDVASVWTPIPQHGAVIIGPKVAFGRPVVRDVWATQDFFNFIQGDPSLLAGIPTLARAAAYGGGFPINVDGEIVGAIGVSGAPAVQNDVDCARAALALAPDALPTEQ